MGCASAVDVSCFAAVLHIVRHDKMGIGIQVIMPNCRGEFSDDEKNVFFQGAQLRGRELVLAG